jgi:hypothetical protein
LVRDVELHTGAAYVIIGRRRSLYRRILLGMVSGQSQARRGNVLKRVPMALWRMDFKCFIKRSSASKRRPRTLRHWTRVWRHYGTVGVVELKADVS